MADPKRVFRRDFAGDPVAPPKRLANGWLQCSARAARVGVQEYMGDDGKVIRELRLPEEVFSPKAMASFAMVPVTNTHPPVLLDAKNTGQYAKGHTGQDIQRDGDWLVVPMMITDEATVIDVEAGGSGVSNGYSCVLTTEQNPEWTAKYGAYDVIQRDIDGNHLAVNVVPRAGPDARVRLDSAGNALLASAPPTAPAPIQESQTMPSMLRFDALGGLTLPMNEDNASAIQSAINRMVAEVTAKADALTLGEKNRADKAEKNAKVILDNAKRILSHVKGAKVALDAVKSRMVPCDECGGTGKVPTTDDATKTMQCDYCDGVGNIREQSAIKAAPGEKDMDDVEEELEGADMDEDELAVEQQTEEEAGKAHSDSKRRLDAKRKTSAEQAKALAKARADSMDRRVARRMDARRKLEGEARKFVSAETDLTKLDDKGVRLAVIKALAPNAKMDGKTETDIASRYAVEVERATEAGTGEGTRTDAAGTVREVPTHKANRADAFAGLDIDPDAARANYLKNLNGKPAAKA